MELVNTVGVVDKVQAVRGREERVLYLEATVHVTFPFQTRYDGNVVSKIPIPFEVGGDIRPGDVVVVRMETERPFGTPFMPALTIGEEE